MKAVFAVVVLIGLGGAGIYIGTRFSSVVLLYLMASVLGLCVLLVVAALLASTRRPTTEEPTMAALDKWIDEAGLRPDRLTVLILLRRLSLWPQLLESVDEERASRVRGHVERTSTERFVRAMSAPHWPAPWRVSAVHLISWLRIPGSEERLAQLMSDRNVLVSHAAAEGLMEIGSAEAYERLMDQIGRDSLPASRIAALLESGESSTLLPVVLKGAEDPVPTRRFWAAYLLGMMPGAEAVLVLCGLTHDPDADVRANAAESLGSVSEDMASDARARLHELLSDPSWVVQSHAVKALAELGAEPSRAALEPLLESPHWWVRYNTGRALALPDTQTREGT